MSSCHYLGQDDGGEVITIYEHGEPNSCDGLWKKSKDKTVVTSQHAGANVSQTIRHCECGENTVVRECLGADVRNSVRQGEGGELSTTAERALPKR